MKEYLTQDSGTHCFVVAVYNSLVHCGLPVPDLQEGIRIAGCENGNTIYYRDLVKWAKAPLKVSGNYREVLLHGGVLGIMHPIYNGHCIFVFPDGEWSVTLVNSWLGPNVMRGIAWDEIEPFVAEYRGVNLGDNWVLANDNQPHLGLAEAMAKLWGVEP